MTPEALAALAARAYHHMTPWSAAQFADSLRSPLSLLVNEEAGFVLGRVVADEAEILALATDPARQRQGVASRLLTQFHVAARERGAVRVFLEVAATNAPARKLYRRHGYGDDGRRVGYYAQSNGQKADALLMARALP